MTTTRLNRKTLSSRECECLHWSAHGKTSWETGAILGISERTVNFHLQNACRKLEVHGRRAAIVQAMHASLIHPLPLPRRHTRRRATAS